MDSMTFDEPMQTMQEMTFPEFEALMNATYAAANWDWKQTAYEVVVKLASKQVPFTTDDVWQVLDGLPVETKTRSALGPVLLRCQKDGVIRKTGVLRRSQRAVNHQTRHEWIGA